MSFVKVGDYTIRHRIGSGASAEVRLATHTVTGLQYAVKIFDLSGTSQQAAKLERAIRKEIRLMQYLRHPNVVHLHHVLVSRSRLYLFMEYVSGGDLYDEIVKHARLDENTTRKYFQQIVDAMLFCHRRGVVHRDLKPENVLLEGDRVKVTDFGMSCLTDVFDPHAQERKLLRTQCGTPKYMAPEVALGKGYDGVKSDAWECGMILYAMLAGALPFTGEADHVVYRKIVHNKVKFPRYFSEEVREVISRLLEKDPLKRASLDEIRRHQWFRVGYSGRDVKERCRLLEEAKPELMSSSVQPSLPLQQQRSQYVNVDSSGQIREDGAEGKREAGKAGEEQGHGRRESKEIDNEKATLKASETSVKEASDQSSPSINNKTIVNEKGTRSSNSREQWTDTDDEDAYNGDFLDSSSQRGNVGSSQQRVRSATEHVIERVAESGVVSSHCKTPGISQLSRGIDRARSPSQSRPRPRPRSRSKSTARSLAQPSPTQSPTHFQSQLVPGRSHPRTTESNSPEALPGGGTVVTTSESTEFVESEESKTLQNDSHSEDIEKAEMMSPVTPAKSKSSKGPERSDGGGTSWLPGRKPSAGVGAGAGTGTEGAMPSFRDRLSSIGFRRNGRPTKAETRIVDGANKGSDVQNVPRSPLLHARMLFSRWDGNASASTTNSSGWTKSSRIGRGQQVQETSTSSSAHVIGANVTSGTPPAITPLVSPRNRFSRWKQQPQQQSFLSESPDTSPGSPRGETGSLAGSSAKVTSPRRASTGVAGRGGESAPSSPGRGAGTSGLDRVGGGHCEWNSFPSLAIRKVGNWLQKKS